MCGMQRNMSENNRISSDQIIGRQPGRMALAGMTIGMLLVVAGTLSPLMGGHVSLYRWIYGIGALLLLVTRIFTPYTGNSIRLKRLYRIESWAALFFCVATFFMFYQPGIMRDWLVFTLAGGAIQVYTSIMIPLVVKKETAKH